MRPPAAAMTSAAVLVQAGVDTRDEYHALFFRVYLPIFAATIFVVYLAIAIAVARGRRREKEPEKEFPKRSHPVSETLYVVFLSGVAAILFFFTFDTERRVDALAADPALRVTIEGFQWQWRFTYPEHDIVVVGDAQTEAKEAAPARTEAIPELVLPAGETVRFSIKGRDVIHSFFVPYMRFKRDANPMMVNTFDLRFPEPGVYPCRCTEYCGLAHTTMRCSIRVLPAARFDEWLAENEGSGQ